MQMVQKMMYDAAHWRRVYNVSYSSSSLSFIKYKYNTIGILAIEYLALQMNSFSNLVKSKILIF